MNLTNIKIKVAGGAGAVVAFLGMASRAFAQITPTQPVIDSDVSAQINAGVAGFSEQLLAQFAGIIPVALGVLVTVVAVYFIVGHFRGMGKV